MATESTYSLAELARVADVTPRTVRYYISQGLLPAPGSGPNARYGEGHLDRLRVIKRLQREHLPLAEIRRRLNEVPDAELADLAGTGREASAAQTAESAVDYIRRVLEEGNRMTSVTPQAPAFFAVPVTPSVSVAASAPAAGAAPIAPPAPPGLAPAAPSAPAAAPAPAEPDRSTWERLTLAPDIELHVRRPLDRNSTKQLDRLIRIARELLADDS